MRISKNVALLCVAAFSSSAAMAKIVYQKNHWYLNDYSASDRNSTACVMGTTEQKNGVTYRLEFLTYKGSVGPTEVQIVQDGRGGAQSMTTTIGSNKKLAFATLTDSGNSKTLMNLPQGLSGLVSYFQNGGELRMYPADGTRDRGVNFEDKGFTQVKERFEQRCLNGENLADGGFERRFLANSHLELSPAGIDLNSTKDIRDLYYQGFRKYKEMGDNNSEIAALRAKFSKELREQAQLKSTITDLSRRIDTRPENQILSDLSRLDRDIPAQEQAVSSATRTRDRAEAAVAPLRSEHNRRSSSASRARSNANSLQNNISNMNRQIGQNEATIENLRSDRVQARRLVRSARNRLPRAVEKMEQARRLKIAYNADSDYRQRVNGNRRWRAATQALPAARQAERAAERLRDAAHDEKERLEDVEKACKRQRPRVDCSTQNAAHRAALLEYRRLEAEEDKVQAVRVRHQSTIRRIETAARDAVNTIESNLQRDLENARILVRDLRHTIRDNEALSDRIVNRDIPNLRSEIRSLDNQVSIARSTLGTALPEATRLEGELSSYERRVGWNEKVRALSNAQSTLNQKASQLNASINAQRNAEQDLQNVREYQSQLDQSRARLTQVNASLAPFESENATLQTQSQSLQGAFENMKSQMAALLN